MTIRYAFNDVLSVYINFVHVQDQTSDSQRTTLKTTMTTMELIEKTFKVIDIFIFLEQFLSPNKMLLFNIFFTKQTSILLASHLSSLQMPFQLKFK